MTEWSYVEHPLIGLGDNKQWYLVGSPERTIGYVRGKEDARLIAKAEKMHDFLLQIEKELRACAESDWYYEELDDFKLLAGDIADSIRELLGEETEHD